MLASRLSRVAPHQPKALASFAYRLLLFSQKDCKLYGCFTTGACTASCGGKEVYLKGPDRVLPADSYTTTHPAVPVKIRKGLHPSADWAPKSVWRMLQDTVAQAPDHIALTVKRDGRWVSWTYAEYEADIRRVAKAFIKLGLRPHRSVAIMGHNAPEWHQANVATMVAGGIATGVYLTNTSEAVDYVLEHSRADIVVVGDSETLAKVSESKAKVAAVIQYEGDDLKAGVLSWESLLKLGDSVPDSVLTVRLEQQAVNQTCMLVYTSGTTSRPKAVMISQDNITWMIQVAQEVHQWRWKEEVWVSYLPLSHVAAQVIDIYLTIHHGATVWFADKDALQGSLIDTLREAQPTQFIGVPRVFEKMADTLQEFGAKSNSIRRAVAKWAKQAALDEHRARMRGEEGGSVAFICAQRLLLSHIRNRLGFGSVKGLYSGAAPLSEQTFNYFLSLDLPIQELLGSSETSGPQTASLPGTGMRAGSVGRCFPHFQTEILNPDSQGIGEIITRGRQICLGYLWNEEGTRELIDDEGWVHSGDLGRIDEDGFLYVCGRIKELIVTAGGENVAPIPIEEAIKEELKVLSNVMLVGDERKHLAALLTFRTVADPAGEPSDELAEMVLNWLKQIGSKATSARQIIDQDCPKVRAALLDAIEAANSKAVSRANKVQKFSLLPSDFSIQTGELTPTLKVKRHFVVGKYKAEIDQMYSSLDNTL